MVLKTQVTPGLLSSEQKTSRNSYCMSTTIIPIVLLLEWEVMKPIPQQRLQVGLIGMSFSHATMLSGQIHDTLSN